MLPVLRLITCGSVDDGKSTLVGRLLHDIGQVASDQLAALERDSARHGTRGGALDFALLFDGLEAEREQGITIDVAYRHFATAQRRFIVADAPGHEQYTRNMATGASTADAAVILVDARKGMLPQTCRHARVVGLMGVRQVILAVNKMDMLDWREDVFRAIEARFAEFAGPLGFTHVRAIPVCATDGDNLATVSRRSPWYAGPSLLAALEAAETGATGAGRAGALRFPVQWVNRPHQAFRGLCGTVAQGRVRRGDAVRVAPSGARSAVKAIIVHGGEVEEAAAGDCVTLTLADELDAGRGDVLTGADAPIECADQFEATLVWLSERELLVGRTYLLRIHHLQVNATVSAIKHVVDVDSGKALAARTLAANAIARVTLATDRPVPYESYAANRRLGAFILIDRADNQTVAAGMLAFALRRAANVHWQALAVGKRERAALKLQVPRCVWLTGLSGAGKSTIANRLESRLAALGRHTFLLDGDNVRHGLNRDLGFTAAARVENVRRVAEVARLMVEAGLIVIVAFISPFRSERDFARSLFDAGEFIEVHVDASMAACEARDPKGLYAKARRGEIANFTGIDSAYEPPADPELRLDTTTADVDACVAQLLEHLES
jgi:bifunctional enzyme CysN/CysC